MKEVDKVEHRAAFTGLLDKIEGYLDWNESAKFLTLEQAEQAIDLAPKLVFMAVKLYKTRLAQSKSGATNTMRRKR